MLYDAYGSILASENVNADLTTTITSQGTLPEADTGLTYRGNGRYYDANLGRPLQPNASGGIPVVPQALNRYAATPVGQPGVAEGTASTSTSVVWLGEQVIKTPLGLALGRLAQKQWGDALAVELQRTVRYQRFSSFGRDIDMLVPATFVRQKLGFWQGSGFSYSRQTRRLAQSVIRTSIGVSPLIVGSPYQDVEVIAEEISPTYIGCKGLAADFGIGLALDIGFQIYGDFGNPYLSPRQKTIRLGVAAGGSVTITGIGLVTRGGLIYFGVGSGPAGWIALGVSFGADYVWETTIKPTIFENRDLNGNLNLEPLGGG